MWFEVISGLKINLTKSELISVGKAEKLDELALVLGCKVGVLPTTYLGLPLGALLICWWLGMEWKKDSAKDWLCGKDNTFPKGED